MIWLSLIVFLHLVEIILPYGLQTQEVHTLQDPGSFKMSVIKFQLDTTSIPLHRFDVQPFQNDVNLGIYSIIKLELVDGINPPVSTNAEYLLWSPVNLNEPVPCAPLAEYQVDSAYYYSYSFGHFLRLANEAFVRALEKLVQLIQPDTFLDTARAPFLIWSADRESATLYTESDYFDQQLDKHVNIYFNRPMYNLFNSFPVINMSHNATKNRNYMIVIQNLKANIKQLAAKDYIKLDQEYSCTQNWSPVSEIVFTTSNLPIVSNQLAPPQL